MINELNNYQLEDASYKFNTTPPKTWNNKSQIDTIFVSTQIYENITRIDHQKLKFCKTDHTLVSMQIIKNYFIKTCGISQHNRSKYKRKIYNYDSMNNKKWTEYEKETYSQLINNVLFLKEAPSSISLKDINL